jgi:hypothetical protein
MAVQYSVAQRNAAISTLSTTVGAAGICKIFVGAQPANCLAPDSGANLVQWTFTATFAGAASSGTVTVNNPAAPGSTALVTGLAGHFRIYQAGATVCVMQGNCTITGGGGDFQLTNLNIAINQIVTFSSMTVSAGNA